MTIHNRLPRIGELVPVAKTSGDRLDIKPYVSAALDDESVMLVVDAKKTGLGYNKRTSDVRVMDAVVAYDDDHGGRIRALFDEKKDEDFVPNMHGTMVLKPLSERTYIVEEDILAAINVCLRRRYELKKGVILGVNTKRYALLGHTAS